MKYTRLFCVKFLFLGVIVISLIQPQNALVSFFLQSPQTDRALQEFHPISGVNPFRENNLPAITKYTTRSVLPLDPVTSNSLYSSVSAGRVNLQLKTVQPQRPFASPSSSYTSLETALFDSTSSETLWFAYYNSQVTDLGTSDYILIGNPSSTSPVSYSATLMTASGRLTNSGSINPGQVVSVSFPSTSGGPLEIYANGPIYGEERYFINSVMTEVPAFESPSPIYYWPYYNLGQFSPQQNNTFYIANPNTNTASASVTIRIGSFVWASPTTIAPGGYLSVSFPNITGGPVQLSATIPVLATERFTYQSQQFGNVATTEIPGIQTLSNQLYLPYYDSSVSSNQSSDLILISNPNTNQQSAQVTINIGATSFSSGIIEPGQTIKEDFPETSNGPLILNSTVPILAIDYAEVGVTLVAKEFSPNPSTFLFLPVYDSTITPNEDKAFISVSNPSPTNWAAFTVSIKGSNLTPTEYLPPKAQLSFSQNAISKGPIYIQSSNPVLAMLATDSGPQAPTVSSITPAIGSVAGGTQVVIQGSNFVGPLIVKFGSLSSTIISQSASTLVVKSPPTASPQQVFVTVENISGSSSNSQLNLFTYATGVGRFPSGSFGYDISWPQCPPSNLPSSPLTVTVVGADYGHPFSVNPCLFKEIAFSQGNYNLYTVIFWNNNDNYPSSPENCTDSASQANCFAYNYGYNSAQWIFNKALSMGISSPVWWLDIEGAPGSSNSLWSTNLFANASAIQGAIDFFQSQYTPGINQKEIVGIYASPCVWPQIVGGFDSGSSCTNYHGYSPSVPGWLADWNNPSNPSVFCASNYAVTSGPIWLVQYGDNIASNNSTFDGDYSC